MNSIIEYVGKFSIYSTISLAAFILLFKLVKPSKAIDKLFMTKKKKNILKRIKYIFLDLNNIDSNSVSGLRLTGFGFKEQGQEEDIKFLKIKNCLESVIKASISTKQKEVPEQTYNNNYNEEDDDDNCKKIKIDNTNSNKFDNRDKVFFSLMEKISKMYVKSETS